MTLEQYAAKIAVEKKAAEGLATAGSGIFSEFNEWGKRLIELDRQASEGREAPVAEVKPVVDSARGAKIFTDVFGDIPALMTEMPRRTETSFKPEARETMRRMESFKPEAREMMRMMELPFEERSEIFAPSTLREALKLYKLQFGAQGPMLREMRKMFGNELSWEELLDKRLTIDQFNEIIPYYCDMGLNCYTWSMGRTEGAGGLSLRNTKAMPGELAGIPFNYIRAYELIRMKNHEPFRIMVRDLWRKDCEALGCELIDEIDGKKVTLDYQPKEGERMVAMMRSKGIPDTHFMLREKDGTWTHKQGLDKPTRFDASGKIITDPEHCNTQLYPDDPSSVYEDFLGYYVIRPVEQA